LRRYAVGSSRKTVNTDQILGGKVKPLKAPKKEKEEKDEDEVAFKAKQAAGQYFSTQLAHILTDSHQTPMQR
jgi:Translation machinery associated TMA7